MKIRKIPVRFNLWFLKFKKIPSSYSQTCASYFQIYHYRCIRTLTLLGKQIFQGTRSLWLEQREQEAQRVRNKLFLNVISTIKIMFRATAG